MWPSLVILLAVAPDRGLARQDIGDRIGDEGIAFQENVAAGFHSIAEAEPDRFVVVDAGAVLDDVVDAAYRAIRSRW